MAQMAKGANYIKGSFTAPSTGSYYTLEFGKSFDKYLFFIELSEESKTALMNTGATGSRTVATFGIYPQMTIGNITISSCVTSKIKPSDSTLSAGTLSCTYGTDSIIFPVGTTGNSNSLYFDYTYSYYVVEIK